MYDSLKQWHYFDNYIKDYLCQNKSNFRSKLLHFQFQYLAKVGNVHVDEAIKLKRDVSPYRSTYRDDYQRVYWQYNEPLRKIEAELGENQRIILVNDQPLPLELILYSREKKGLKYLVLPKIEDFDAFIKKVVRGGYTLSMQETASIAVRLGIETENPTYALPKQAGFNIESLEDLLKLPGLKSPLKDLLKGFVEIDDIFKEKKLLHDSYRRIAHYSQGEMPITWLDNHRLENRMELIFEEMVLWLMVLEPYTQKDLEEEILKKIPTPAFLKTTQSGMGALSEIIKIIVKPSSNVLYFDDCYFESIDLFAHANCQKVSFPDYELPIIENVDVLFVDFHNNFVEGKFKTSAHDILAILKKVLPFTSETFTLVIDTTIGFGDEVQPILDAYPNLNVIAYWSHQKFNMFGTDKFSAGSYAVYSKNKEPVFQFQNQRGNVIDWVSLQGLTHFFKFGKDHLRKRAEKIFEKTQYVHSRIDPELKNIVQKQDPYSYSVDVQGDWSRDDELRILKEFEELGLPLMSRPSFGYNTITFGCICNKILRFSIGIEPTELLDQFVKGFNRIFSKEPKTAKGIAKKLDVALE